MSLHDRLKMFGNEKLTAEKKAGADFLAENKTKEGVQELPGGIQYLIVKEGAGEKPTASSKIKAHYKGSILSGKEFDSSYRRNQPFTASLNQLIQGWQQVIGGLRRDQWSKHRSNGHR